MPGSHQHHKPTFFWQGVFILLPVALMSAFGFWAILRQRNEVEQEARQQAQTIVRSLPDNVGAAVASQLAFVDADKNAWFDFLRQGIAAWPESKKQRHYLSETNKIRRTENEVANLKSALPQWKAGAPPLVNLMLNTNGGVYALQAIPPRPPKWLLGLTSEQFRAWMALAAADAAGTLPHLTALAAAFEQTKPPVAARICAAFMRLRAESRIQPAPQAIGALTSFAARHAGIESGSGLPLTTLALAEALNRAHECGPTAALWKALNQEVDHSGLLTPHLLAEAAQLVTNNIRLSKSIQAMRILLADKHAQRELAEAIGRTINMNGSVSTNLWIDAMNRRWFCILQPETLNGGTKVSNHSIHRTNIYTKAWCFPKSFVDHAFSEVLRRANISLPDYFGASVILLGRTIPPQAQGNGSKLRAPGVVLAERQFPLSQTAAGLKNRAAQSKAKFTVQIRLIDRRLLYARQRQLQFIFGTLIALAALAALIGFLAARRSFRREQQLNEVKSNFVSSVSHELRAPIASVRLMAENLENGKVSGPERQSEYFHFIRQECRRLSSLIEKVLDFSRIEQGRKQYEFELTDLVELTRTTVKLMEPYATEKGVALRLEAARSPDSNSALELNVDGRAIQQALVNLMDNAIKHSAKGQCVVVQIRSATNAPHRVNLSVRDQGPGIPAAEQQRIFERFYRLGSELRRETQGVGIGLSIVKHIIEAHGGRLIVESQPGRGSCFTIELPGTQTTTPD